MNIISLREQPLYLEKSIAYFQKTWATPHTEKIYEDCLRQRLHSPNPLPQWYLLYPWLAALFIEDNIFVRTIPVTTNASALVTSESVTLPRETNYGYTE